MTPLILIQEGLKGITIFVSLYIVWACLNIGFG